MRVLQKEAESVIIKTKKPRRHEKGKNMKIAILDRKALGEDLPLTSLAKYGEVVTYDATSPEQLCERVADVSVIVVNKVKITAQAFAAAKELKLICEFATGFDNIDLAAAREHGVAVTNVPGYSTESVLLTTLATVSALAFHLGEYHGYVADGRYSASGVANLLAPVYHELAGRTWGIVGCGNIGSRVADVARALGMRVIVHKRTPSDRFTCVDMDTLVRESDVITLHCPLNDGTRHIIDARRLSMMKPDAILVNEARGAVVDEAAVAQAILGGKLGAFGSDVYSVEPFGKDHPFYAIKDKKNVLLTPHAAWGAYESRARCLGVIEENMKAFFAGERKNRVD